MSDLDNTSRIVIVIPVYNEEGNISKCINEIFKHTKDYNIFLLFVDDGSSDGTLSTLKKESNKDVGYISFSRNFGHQNALRAGIENAQNFDCIITMDGDLQHPPSFLPNIIEKWKEGFDVVLTKRIDDKRTSFFKRFTSSFFYKLLNGISDVDILEGGADFRLIDKSVVDQIKRVKDPNLFLRGLIPWVGFKQHVLEFKVDSRHSGDSKYTFKKMSQLAVDGLMSFSIKPLRIAVVVGLFFSLIAFIYSAYALAVYLFLDEVVSGWTSLVISVLLIGGIQLFFLGIIGEYIGRIFMTLKSRPNYIIKETSEEGNG